MVKLSNYEQADWAATRTFLLYDPVIGRGIYHHPAGFARVYTVAGEVLRLTCIRFIHNGRVYSRRWETVWGERTIARLCREFIEEVADKPQPGSE